MRPPAHFPRPRTDAGMRPPAPRGVRLPERWRRVAFVSLLFVSAGLRRVVHVSNHMESLLEVRNLGGGSVGAAGGMCANYTGVDIRSLWDGGLGRAALDAALRDSGEHGRNAKFASWVERLLADHYSARRLRASSTVPPDPVAALRLLRIASDRLVSLSSPPLRVLVMGGSVTAGVGCGANPVGLPPGPWQERQLECAWPSRLEGLFNRALFGGRDVVRVTNLATGGASTEVGRVVLEYQLFDNETRSSPPHVVVWAHASNDSQEDLERVRRDSLPGFVAAARDLRPCDPDLPLVVVLDDFYGFYRYANVHETSALAYEAASWFGLMGVSHASVVRGAVYAESDNDAAVASVLGGQLNLHPGVGNHIGVAWSVFYNFVKAFVDACGDVPELRRAKDDGRALPNMKSIGGYRRGEEVHPFTARWREHAKRREELCSGQNATAAASGGICTYAWMVNPITGVSQPWNVKKQLGDGGVSSVDGWEAMGTPVRQPRTGWYARKGNATFSLEVTATLETKYVTILSMKSYGDNFVGSLLRLTVQIRRPGRDGGGEAAAEGSFEVSGHHETQTSIHVPHKFELPGGGAGVGDVVHADFVLVGGSYFKIAGIAFCSR